VVKTQLESRVQMLRLTTILPWMNIMILSLQVISLYLSDNIYCFKFFISLACALDTVMMERQQKKPESQVINICQVRM
jgi:hypothetical protein